VNLRQVDFLGYELRRLRFDFDKCNSPHIKKQIYLDIDLLQQALQKLENQK